MAIPPPKNVATSGVGIPTEGRELSCCIRHRGSPKCPAAVGDSGAASDPAAEDQFGENGYPQHRRRGGTTTRGRVLLCASQIFDTARVFDHMADRE